MCPTVGGSLVTVSLGASVVTRLVVADISVLFAVLMAQSGENVLTGQRVYRTVVVTDVALHLGNKLVLVDGSDDSVATWASQVPVHSVSYWGG
jgi:hypothetical protein